MTKHDHSKPKRTPKCPTKSNLLGSGSFITPDCSPVQPPSINHCHHKTGVQHPLPSCSLYSPCLSTFPSLFFDLFLLYYPPFPHSPTIGTLTLTRAHTRSTSTSTITTTTTSKHLSCRHAPVDRSSSQQSPLASFAFSSGAPPSAAVSCTTTTGTRQAQILLRSPTVCARRRCAMSRQ